MVKNVRYNKLLRIGKRSLQLLQASNLPTQFRSIAPQVSDSYQRFCDAQEVLREQTSSERLAREQVRAAFSSLRHQYDISRIVLQASTSDDPAAHEPGSAIEVFEDLLEAARKTHLDLATSQEPWAKELIAVFTETLGQADQTWKQGLESRTQLQKAQAQCRALAGRLESVLVNLRRMVRVTYGVTSKEYQLLRASHAQTQEDQAPENQTPVPLLGDKIPNQNAA